MKNVKPKDIKREWHLIDAKDQILGRLSTSVATMLSGKNKVQYTPYLDTGDYVVIINAAEIALSGKKEQQKKYYRYSGYPSGLKSRTVEKERALKPESIVRHAIKGMLPQNKLGRAMIKKLYIYASDENPHAAKFAK